MLASLDEFIEYLGSQRDTDTAKTYKSVLSSFERYLTDQGKTLDEFSPIDVEMFMSQKQPATANVFLAAIRKYARYRASKASMSNEFILEQQRLLALYNIKPKKIYRKIQKQALSIDELDHLLELIAGDYELYVATMFHFYFGMRPIEATVQFVNGKVYWKERYMIIRTAKAGHERMLPWIKEMDQYIHDWYDIASRIVSRNQQPNEWYTKHMKPYSKALGFKVTAKTARKTFETQMRKQKLEQWMINFLLGHTTKIPDIYTDWTQLLEDLRTAMVTKHYMLPLLTTLGGDGHVQV